MKTWNFEGKKKKKKKEKEEKTNFFVSNFIFSSKSINSSFHRGNHLLTLTIFNILNKKKSKIKIKHLKNIFQEQRKGEKKGKGN